MSNVQIINALDDPRLDSYRNLKDRELARMGGMFIAEGEFVVQRLLASSFPVESVLLAERRVEEISPLVPRDVPIYVAAAEIIHSIIGFKFHSGIIACGRRKPLAKLEDALSPGAPGLTLIVCPEIANAENLGGLIRIAAGFGVDAMVLGERCCDPFFRQAIRVSMGTVFSLPIVQSGNVVEDLKKLSQCGVETIATVLDENAENLAKLERPERVALVFGNEAQGLSKEVVDACTRRVTIPMKLGTDSLNVIVSAGIFLWQLRERE